MPKLKMRGIALWILLTLLVPFGYNFFKMSLHCYNGMNIYGHYENHGTAANPVDSPESLRSECAIPIDRRIESKMISTLGLLNFLAMAVYLMRREKANLC